MSIPNTSIGIAVVATIVIPSIEERHTHEAASDESNEVIVPHVEAVKENVTEMLPPAINVSTSAMSTAGVRVGAMIS